MKRRNHYESHANPPIPSHTEKSSPLIRLYQPILNRDNKSPDNYSTSSPQRLRFENKSPNSRTQTVISFPSEMFKTLKSNKNQQDMKGNNELAELKSVNFSNSPFVLPFKPLN